MARTKQAEKTETDVLVLVGPDGSERTPRNEADNVALRFRGYLPKEQASLDAPEPVASGATVDTSGTNPNP